MITSQQGMEVMSDTQQICKLRKSNLVKNVNKIGRQLGSRLTRLIMEDCVKLFANLWSFTLVNLGLTRHICIKLWAHSPILKARLWLNELRRLIPLLKLINLKDTTYRITSSNQYSHDPQLNVYRHDLRILRTPAQSRRFTFTVG